MRPPRQKTRPSAPSAELFGRNRNNINPLCTQCREQLFDFLDGSLDTAALAVLQVHLRDCAPCRRELQRHQRADTALASALQSIPPAGNLLDGFHERLAASEAQRDMGCWRLTTPAFALRLLVTGRRQLYTPFGKIKLAAPALALGLLAVALIHQGRPQTKFMETRKGYGSPLRTILNPSQLAAAKTSPEPNTSTPIKQPHRPLANFAPPRMSKRSSMLAGLPPAFSHSRRETGRQAHKGTERKQSGLPGGVSRLYTYTAQPGYGRLSEQSLQALTVSPVGVLETNTIKQESQEAAKLIEKSMSLDSIARLVSQTPPVGYDAPASSTAREAFTAKNSVALNGIQVAPDASKDLVAIVPSLSARDREYASLQDFSKAHRVSAAKAPLAPGDSQGFTMVVQDDARGFTFESHCAETEIDDSGERVIHIEVSGGDMPPSTR